MLSSTKGSKIKLIILRVQITYYFEDYKETIAFVEHVMDTKL